MAKNYRICSATCYLSDDTIFSNIAFGVNPSEINHQAVEKVSKIANLHNFVVDELPNKYQTIIGGRDYDYQ